MKEIGSKIVCSNAYPPLEKLPWGTRKAYGVSYKLDMKEASARLRRGIKVNISWGLNLRRDELEPNKKYVWVGQVFDMELGRFRDDFEQVI